MQSLNDKKLRLSATLETITRPDGVRLVKQRTRAEYLALSREQQGILDRFDGRRTVQEILRELLTENHPVRLRPFYELVLNLWQKGFLFEGENESTSPRLRGRRWPSCPTSPALLSAVALLVMLAGAPALARSPLPVIATWTALLGTGVMASFGLSLGNLLAGCALSALGREVYRPRCRWDRVLPFFAVDVRDAFMGGRATEIAVALATLTGPMLLAIAAALSGMETALLGAWLSLVALATPFGNSPAHQLLHAGLRRDYELPRCAERFLSTRMVGRLVRWREPLHEERYFTGYSTYAILWLGLVYWLGARLLEAEGDLFADWVNPASATSGRLAALGVFGLLALLAAGPLAYGFWVLARAVWRGLAPICFNAEAGLQRRAGPGRDQPSPAELEKFLGATLLFSQLPPGELQRVARAMRFVRVVDGTVIIRERDPGRSLFVVHSGTVEVLKENEAGKNARVATLGPGDVFGEIALLDQVRRTSTVRSLGPASVLVLDKADFEAVLLSGLGAKAVRDTVQVCAFLHRQPLFAEWHPQPLLRLSSAFALASFAAGAVVLHENQANDSFYLVKEGAFTVRAKGKPLATLGPGDFFGEISLLRHQPTIAEVVCLGGGACLRLGREDFLQLISQSFVTGLAIEQTGDARDNRKGTA